MMKKSVNTAKCFVFLILISRAFGEHIIGGIFDENHEDDKKAFEAAIRLVNLQRNDDQQLKPVIEILDPYDMFRASSKACQQLEAGAITIFGPYNPDNFEAIQSVCDAKEVPVIQTRWNHRPQRDSSIMNFYPHTPQLTNAYVEIIKKLEWKRFILFYDDDESFLRLLDLMKLSQDKSYLIITRQLDPDDTGIYREQFREISESPVNNIVIDCRLEVLQEVLRQAQQLGLMNRNYNYFITNLDFHTIDMEPFQYSNTNITGVKLIKTDSKMTTDFVAEVESEKKEDEENEFSLKTSSALIADAMFMLSDALTDLEEGASPSNEGHGCNSSKAWEHGSSLVNMIRTIKTEGRTGMMKFDNEGFRSDFTLIITEVQERGLVDIGYWNMSEGTQIQRPLPYPEKSHDEEEDETSLVNKTLIVITALTEPYTFLKDSSEKLIGNDRYEGFGVDLIDEMAKMEKFNYIIVLRGDKSNGARNSETGQWSGMIGDLINKTADLAIADLTINSERAEAVDFTTPFMELGIKILFQKPAAAPPNFFSFAEPFAVLTWLSIAVSYVFISLSLFIMGRLSAAEWTNPFPCIEEPEYLINQFSLSNSFWFSTGTGLQQGTEIAPIAISTRVVAGMWWFFILLMVASYTANLAAFLANEIPLKLFTDVESLVKNADELKIRYGAKAKGATEKFFKDSKDHKIYGQIYKHMLEHKEDMPSDNKIGVTLAENEKYAFFMESTSIEYETERHCGLEMYGDYLDRKGYGIAMRKNSTYRSRLSTTVLKLQSAGVIDDLKRKWWQERRGGGQCVTDEDDADAKPLGMRSLEGVFYVTVYGIIGGYIFAVLERLAYVMSISKKTKMSFFKALIYEIKFYVNFDSNVKPVLGSNANLADGEEPENEATPPAKPYGFITNSNEKLEL